MSEHLLEHGAIFRRWIEEGVPGFASAIGKCHQELQAFLGGTYSRDLPLAIPPVLCQASNNFCDLLVHLAEGRGRPALLTSRTLFEGLVAIRDLAEDRDDALDRYAAHRAVTRYMLGQLRGDLALYEGARRKAQMRLRSSLVRDAAEDVEGAGDRWPGFRRSWSGSTLHDRAALYSYADEYMFYRVASAVVHASAGGDLGLFREIGGRQVFRTGPALAACPIAFSYGCQFFRDTVEVVAQVAGSDASQLVQSIDELLVLGVAYRSCVERLDREAWPDAPPPPRFILRALLPDGSRIWVAHDRATSRIISCEPPTNSSAGQLDATERVLDAIEQDQPHRDEWLTVALEGAVANPTPGARWRDERILLGSDIIGPSNLYLPWDG